MCKGLPSKTNGKEKGKIMVEGMIMEKFDDFWSIYPRKKEKKRARVSFNRLPKQTQEDCIQGVKDYIKQIEAQGTETRFIKHPSTFINGENWGDDFDTEVLPESSTPPKIVGVSGAVGNINAKFKGKKETQFLFFKEHFSKSLPAEKWDDEDKIREQFLTLNGEEMKYLLLGLEYENNQWRQPDCDLQFEKRASVYLQKRAFMRDDIVKPVKTKMFDDNKRQQFIIETYGSMEEYRRQKDVKRGS